MSHASGALFLIHDCFYNLYVHPVVADARHLGRDPGAMDEGLSIDVKAGPRNKTLRVIVGSAQIKRKEKLVVFPALALLPMQTLNPGPECLRHDQVFVSTIWQSSSVSLTLSAPTHRRGTRRC
jgi:hypothetical protein